GDTLRVTFALQTPTSETSLSLSEMFILEHQGVPFGEPLTVELDVIPGLGGDPTGCPGACVSPEGPTLDPSAAQLTGGCNAAAPDRYDLLAWLLVAAAVFLHRRHRGRGSPSRS